MKYNLYRIETYGIKNISNLITINFTNQTINKNQKKECKIKAIYGTNGVGKSALMNSIEIYKQLNLDSNYLKQKENIIKLNKLLNKNKKEFYFSIVYGVYKDNKITNVYKHQIKLNLENETPYIQNETLSILKDKTINGTYQDIYTINKGELVILNKEHSDINTYIYDKTKNILINSTLPSLLADVSFSSYLKELLEAKHLDINTTVIYHLLTNNSFTSNITIFLDEKDIHNEVDIESFDNIITLLGKQKENLLNRISSNEDLILKTKLDQYKQNVKRLSKFIMIFKPNLLDIKVDVKEDEHFYHCTKKMVYDNYEIDSDYESTGIQKIMKIYSAIEDVTKGKIVFIDELDANINGVYINKLIEYLNDLSKGQLCFTLHDFYPMKYLYKYSNSIEFMGETGKLVSWVKNGNYRPYEKYPEGMIEDSSFNIEPFDFINVFESVEE